MEAQSPYPTAPVTLKPGVISSYKNGWSQLWKHFLVLFVIGVIYVVLSFSSGLLEIIPMLGILLSIAYGVFFLYPLGYGQSFAYLKASRGDNVEVQDMFASFQNYWNAVGAYLLTTIIVGIGFILVIVPGIFLACRLAFVPYLVVDKRMGVMEAINASWNMTKGHGWEVFLIYLLGIPIVIAGLICLVLGVIISFMWISSAIASLYHAVSTTQASGPVGEPPPMSPVVG